MSRGAIALQLNNVAFGYMRLIVEQMFNQRPLAGMICGRSSGGD
jgi:hypothetical protein